ncbi:MAG: hypothetical protein IJC08_00240, partial [Bacteroidaceae bacterium]|nr:hypothetical protein [Bacteroidaceae bacterium]
MKTFHTDIAVQRSSSCLAQDKKIVVIKVYRNKKYEPSKIVIANLYKRLNPVSIKQTTRFLIEATKKKN